MRALRDGALALSLSNLCFFRVWAAYFYGYHRPYFRKDPTPGWDYVALVLDIVLLAALFWAGAALARRLRRPIILAGMRFSFLLVLLLAVAVIRASLLSLNVPLSSVPSPLSARTVLLTLLLGLPALYGLWRWQARLARICVPVVLLVFPFVPVTFLQAAWRTAGNPPAQAEDKQPVAAPVPSRDPSAPRVLWLVFDEMDQRVSFAERPPGLKLPELDRLRRRALYATNAYAPTQSTLFTMPALITGREIAAAEPSAANELMLSLAGTLRTVPWSGLPSIFSKAHEAGVSAGLVGWFHPYCPILGSSLALCSWTPYRFTEKPRGLPERMRDQAALFLWSLPFAMEFFTRDPLNLDLLPTRSWREGHSHKYFFVHERAREMASNPALGLVFVHSPVPHAPPIYDRQTREFGPAADYKEWYLDNLALVDRALADLRRSLESAGLWEKTSIVLTSDHNWRRSVELDGKADRRVPFLLVLAGQSESMTYEPAFNTLLAHDLILAILRGELERPEQVAPWLDQHKHLHAVPAPGGGQAD